MFRSNDVQIIASQRKRRVEGLLGGEKTLIIVDWDDTLFPTTWLTTNGGVIMGNIGIGRIIEDFLNKAIELGHVVIITNADPGWVYGTSEQYVPEILKYLKSIPICSARQFSRYGQDEMANWKYRAFNSVIQEFNKEFDGIKNVISIGDSNWDRDAVFYVFESNKRVQIVPKAIKLLNYPTLEALREQLVILTLKLEEIVLGEGANIYEMKYIK